MQVLNGFVKIHRKLLRWGWYQDSVVKGVFLHLLLTANFKDAPWQGRIIKAGQVVTSYKHLSDDLGFGVRQIRTAINKLKSTGEIATETTNKYTLITMVNWEEYQCCDENMTNEVTRRETSERQSTDNQPTSERQSTDNNVRIYKNIKNKRIKEKKNINIYSSAIVGTADPAHEKIIAYLNHKTHTHYRTTTKKTQELIEARMREGFVIDDFMTVIDNKCSEWIDTEWEKFLRPTTLFGNKFEEYLNGKQQTKTTAFDTEIYAEDDLEALTRSS